MKGEVTTYNKLVRDNIPMLLAKSGYSVSFRALKGEELKEALKNKLLEEVYEFINAKTINQQIEELADISTVLEAIEREFGISTSLVAGAIDNKMYENGHFYEGLYLETATEVEDDAR